MLYNDMPKLTAPFERVAVGTKSYVTTNIDPTYRWVFDEDSIAVEKLDGTNVSVAVKDCRIVRVFNRTKLIDPWIKDSSKFVTGLVEAQVRDYFNPAFAEDGQYFGELLGPEVGGNPYNLNTNIWMPFEHLKNQYTYKFWPEFRASLIGKTDIEIFNEVSTLFQNLWSIFKRHYNFPGNIKDVNIDCKFEKLAAEGIVFYRPNGEMCKLRRDMFAWFSGPQHGE